MRSLFDAFNSFEGTPYFAAVFDLALLSVEVSEGQDIDLALRPVDPAVDSENEKLVHDILFPLIKVPAPFTCPT